MKTPTRQKWEYQVLASMKLTLENLNELGEQGWELVHMSEVKMKPPIWQILLKRPKL